MTILSWDLETSNLGADYGVILCAGYKEVGKGTAKVIDISQYPGTTILQKERVLLADLTKVLMDADVWLTWFGTFFDVPFLNTRLIYHGMSPLPASHAHIDGWRTARNRLKLRNNRLITVQEFLGTPTAKDAVLGPKWILAISGHRPSLQYVINHCKKDVKALEEVYTKLRPLIIDHPYSETGDCTVCGGSRLIKRGFHRTVTNKYQRYQCRDCGRWSRDAKPLMRKPRVKPRAL